MRQRTGMVCNREVHPSQPVRMMSPWWNLRLPARLSRNARYNVSVAATSSRVGFVRTDIYPITLPLRITGVAFARTQ